MNVTINADVEISAAVRAHLDGAGYQLAALLPALRGHPDRVVITGDASEMAPLLPEGLPPCGGPHPVATFVVHITVAVSALARACAASLVRKVLTAKASARPCDVVIVVLLANGETGVMTAELELVSSAPTPPADPVCNAPGGRA